MGCLLIEAVLENNKLLEPPPPPSLLNSHYSDLLAKQEPFLLFRKWPLIICISMWDQWRRRAQFVGMGRWEERGPLLLLSPVTETFDSQGICMGNKKNLISQFLPIPQVEAFVLGWFCLQCCSLQQRTSNSF